jgi:septal ring factor EnvC (AmiA/AmiB activator)
MTVIAIPAELTSQLSEITATVASIEAEQTKLSTKKTEALEAQARLNLVVSYLNGTAPLPATTTATGRKPMSQEARDNIRAGLEKARLNKQAEKAPAAPETPRAPSVAAPVAEPIPAPANPAEAKSAKKAAGK